MGRKAEGWKVRWKRGWAYARFTWQKHQYSIALGTQDPREAPSAAARAYSDVVSGRLRPIARRPGQLVDLSRLWAEWVEWKTPSVDVETVPMLESYGRRFVDYFKSLDRITEANATSYSMARLGQVTRSTLLKELCFLRQFLRWCVQQNALAAVPEVPQLPPKARGKRTGTQRVTSVMVTPAQAKAIIALLPLESKTIGGRKWPVRARFDFMWETTFRPETISCLSVPEHWQRGQRYVRVTEEIDKARFGRLVDLTPKAIAILDKVAPKRGLIFGRHEFAKAIKKAAKGFV